VLRLIIHIIRWSMIFLVIWTGVTLLLTPRPRVGVTPGQHVKYSAYSADESKLLLVTMPNLPFS
jgi:hypothetical protein